MANIKIPARVDPKAYTMRVELDGLFYDLSFRFNARDDHWYMDVSFGDVVSIYGVKVVHSEDLLRQFAHLKVEGRIPPGTMRVFDITGFDRDPDITTFGDDVVLLYEEV